MQIEEGKFYKNRAGFKVGPMKYHDDPCDTYNWEEGFKTYTDKGFERAWRESDGDLIEEWKEPTALPLATAANEGWGPWNQGKLQAKLKKYEG